MSSLLEAMWLRWQRPASATLNNLWSRPVGQALLRHMDRLLWTLEKAHYWSVPPNPDKPPLTSNELTRPLPWIVFIPLLAVLRISRETASFAALLLGKEPIRPADIVKFIQQRRRAVRALKYQGTRAMRARAHHSRQTNKRSFLRQLMRPLEATIRLTTGGLLFSPQLHKTHHDHGDRTGNSNSHKRRDTEENLLEKLLQNADLSDNTSTDDTSYTLKNASDSSESSSSSEIPSFVTAEDVNTQRDEQNSTSCTSSPLKELVEPNKTFTVNADEDSLQKEQTKREVISNEDSTTKKSDSVDQGNTVLVDESADIKQIVNDILNSERESSANEITKSSTESNPVVISKGSHSNNSKRDSPSKSIRTPSVPIVSVTLADDDPIEESPTKGSSRQGKHQSAKK